MAAAVALSNYQLGDILGRGASGSVYRALNFLTGETVAIKSISLLSLPPSSLPDIMSEIDLLKNLNHPNIVKYKGFARDKENLFIVLEYCENGSLQSILKKFGKFPESLIAVYISQVLEGLIYLHEQGVIHRDIKGANILTNKDGSVKLADFGVSSKNQPKPSASSSPGMEHTKKEDNDNEVVGSPYWMAPEVIEQNGASTASDIWSVGCVIVELLEGKPPYGELAPMQALWRIVQDEGMKIPDGASPIVKDFLYHCFQKDPNLRVSAKKLLRHPWMMSVKKSTEPPVQPVPPRTPSSRPQSRAGSVRVSSGGRDTVRSNERKPTTGQNIANTSSGSGSGSGSGTVRAKKPMTVYDEAVQRVQEWNEALNGKSMLAAKEVRDRHSANNRFTASPKALGTMRRLPLPQPRKQSVSNVRQRGESNGPLGPGLFALPSRSSGDAISSQLHPTSGLPIPISQPGIIGKNLHVSDVLNRAKESEGDAESWDDDFAADITLTKKIGHRRDESAASEDLNQKTLRPTKSPAVAMKSLPPLSSEPSKLPSNSRSTSAGQMEDYSDIGLDEDELGLETKLKNLKLKSHGRKGLMHPDDIHKVPLSPIPSAPQRSLSTPFKPSLPVPITPSPRTQARSPPSSRQSSLRGKNTPGTAADNSESLVELNKYMEKDEGYDDIFEGVQPSQASGSKLHTQSLQLTRRSNVSWASDEADEEQDPFAEIEDDFVTEDLEAILLRDKRATLHANVNKLVEDLTPSTPHGVLKDGCDELLSLLENTPPEMGLEAHFVAQHGMLAILEVLESRLSRDVAVRLLKLVNLIVTSDLEMLESFCLIGGIPVIIPYTSKKHSLETRLEASTFIQQLTSSALTLQMFISCRGLRILVELLDEDYALNKTLVLSSLEGISSVFDLSSPTPKPDFVRMFVREGILDPLSTALLSILKDDILKHKVEEKEDQGEVDKEELESAVNRTVATLLLFCQVAQGDRRVQDGFANRGVMTRILKACDLLSGKSLVMAIKAIKHLATSTQLIEVVQNSNGIEILVGILARNMKGSHASETVSNLFQTIYSMTKLSKSRQEEAASSGIIPLLKKVVQSKSQMSDFALPILCDLANAGKVSRRLLWRYDGLNLYLDLLSHPYWQVSALDAILTWLVMQDETARVEDVLLEKSASDSLVKCFVQASGVSFEGILDPLIKILRLSTSLTSSISHPPFYTRLSETLEKSTHAAIKLNLLRLTRVVCDTHPDRQNLVIRFGLKNVIERLSKQDSAILVRELAKEVLPGLLFGSDAPDPVDLVNLKEQDQNQDGTINLSSRPVIGKDREGGSGLKRTMSENVLSDRFAYPQPQPHTSSSTSTVRSIHSISSPAPAPVDKSTHQRMTLSRSSTLSSTLSKSQIDSRNMPPPPLPAPILPSLSGGGERPKHKRKISRNQLR
uniref:non-specific serine/threonine protein kinase n=1 Tax=Kwoniella bestiolae CBS 10118 TaxID=1296100 RepID=A0A1B9G127_9TREE|nr:STE/STE11/CDC15 protein kinase [Kwoniella bestiolae CBS 10118]OCF24721.1 STE/STE11/CDC15 protein kinase [Kwoniella bestiolae CBS 10118]